MVRGRARALIAVVQRSKDDAWVLPRGKLKRNENPVIGARREVVEETGHRVRVHEFLGAITYRASGRAKVVQFWRMEAEAKSSHDLMADIAAVEWLPLKAAARRLSYPLEKLFLRNIGRQALSNRARDGKPRKPKHKATAKKTGKKANKKTKKKAGEKSAKKTAKAGRARPSSAKAKKKPQSKRKAPGHRAAPPAVAGNSRALIGPVRRQSPRAPATITALAAKPATVTPISAADHKSILQRMLGRLAG